MVVAPLFGRLAAPHLGQDLGLAASASSGSVSTKHSHQVAALSRKLTAACSRIAVRLWIDRIKQSRLRLLVR